LPPKIEIVLTNVTNGIAREITVAYLNAADERNDMSSRWQSEGSRVEIAVRYARGSGRMIAGQIRISKQVRPIGWEDRGAVG
jgi:hypothetical protein